MNFHRIQRAVFVSLGLFTLLAAPARAQTACQGSTGPDVIVGDITGPQNYSTSGGYDALSLGTTSCNLGTQPLGWHSSTNQHPVIGGELYKYKVVNGAGRFEQVGLSWLKHGFFALSQGLCCSGCQGTDGSTLGVRCSDPYTADRNGQQTGLGPRYQVNPYTGAFTYPPPRPSGGNLGRCEVATTDLEASSASVRYFANCQYIAPDDALAGNGWNNCSSREVTVSGSGTVFNFGFSGTTNREVAALKLWAACDVGANIKSVQFPGEGMLLLGYKVTALPNNVWHYEYAVYNQNSDDAVRSFTVPIAANVNVTNMGFHDVARRGGDGVGGVAYDGTDWPNSLTGGNLAWATSTFGQNQNANAIRWGTTYNFRFDADTAPMAGSVTLGRFKTGGSQSASASVPSPGVPPIDTDGDGVFDGVDNCPLVPNAGQANADGDSTGDACDTCTDTDGDGFGNPGFANNTCADDNCPTVANASQADADGDLVGDSCDGCPSDPAKIAPGQCGCGAVDVDSDLDGTADCVDGCPSDGAKTAPGQCGCGVADLDADSDSVADCNDNCASVSNPGQEDCDGDGTGNACEIGAEGADCNMNGIADGCDILAATSQDANLDGVPDECQQAGGISFCFGDGTGDACPCSNSGGPGRGCANSNAGSTGALLAASGTTSPDTIVFTSSGERPTALTIFTQGTSRLTNPALFGDGLRCVSGTLKRIGAKGAVGGVATYPQGGDLSVSARSAALGDTLDPGDIRIYQAYYRDQVLGFCPDPLGANFNVSQAVQLVW